MLASAKQRQLCLGEAHVGCATYKAASELLATSHQDALEAGLWPRSSSRVVTFDPVRTGLAGGLTTPQARAGGQALLVGLIAVAFVVLVIARSSGPSDPGGGAGSPGPTTAAGAVSSASPAATSTPPASAPAASPGVSPEPRPTPTVEASAAADQTYKVKRGDTLSGIALKFGVTVKALRKANGLTKYDVIKRGQVLVIPGTRASPAP